MGLVKKLLSKAGKYLVPVTLAAALNNSCLERCPVPDKRVVITLPKRDQQIEELVTRLYNYSNLQTKNGVIGKDIDPQQYVKSLGEIIIHIIKREFELDISGISIDFFNSREKFCEEFGMLNHNHQGCSLDFYHPNCNQIFFDPFFESYPDKIVCDLETIAHVLGHYMDIEVYGKNGGEKISMFFQHALHLIGYTSVSPKIESDKFEHIFQLLPNEGFCSYNLLNSLKNAVNDFTGMNPSLAPYLIGDYAFWKSIKETEGDFKKALFWLLDKSDENIVRMYKESVTNKQLCNELGEAVSYIKDFLLSKTGGGYLLRGVNLTEWFINSLHQEINRCKTLRR